MFFCRIALHRRVYAKCIDTHRMRMKFETKIDIHFVRTSNFLCTSAHVCLWRCRRPEDVASIFHAKIQSTMWCDLTMWSIRLTRPVDVVNGSAGNPYQFSQYENHLFRLDGLDVDKSAHVVISFYQNFERCLNCKTTKMVACALDLNGTSVQNGQQWQWSFEWLGVTWKFQRKKINK